MTGEPREVEVKLIVRSDRPREVVQRVAGLESLAGYRVMDRGELHLRDVYFDTADGSLVRSRAALRLRYEGPRVLVTLKAQAGEASRGMTDRLEIELAWSADALRRVVEALGGLGIRLPRPAAEAGTDDPVVALEGMGLRVVQDRVTRRRVRDVVPSGESGARMVAELVVDSVEYVAEGRRAWHHEVEVEAEPSGDPGLLEELADALLADFPDALRPWPYSKQATGKAVEALLGGGEVEGLLGPEGDLAPAAYERIDRYLAGR